MLLSCNNLAHYRLGELELVKHFKIQFRNVSNFLATWSRSTPDRKLDPRNFEIKLENLENIGEKLENIRFGKIFANLRKGSEI